MKAVILAGGLGERLKPFTNIIPKPLLPFGEKSLLEIQIEYFASHGIKEIYIAINYRADMIRSFLGNGEKYGVRLYYSEEDKPLGTCGPVGLLKDELTEPFFLMNGDILTKAPLREIYDFACRYHDSWLTIITKIVTTPFRFGSIQSEGDYVTHVEEKPNLNFEILAGIYILKPSIFQLIPENTYFGIDQLIHTMLANNHPITKYLLKEYWVDIGIIEDYDKARTIYEEHFKE